MADQLIVLGNGFDLACGLKSSYSDFFEWLYKTKKDDNSNDASKIKFEKKEVIEENFWMLLFWELHNCYNNWADVESEIEKTLNYLNSKNTYQICNNLLKNRYRNYGNLTIKDLEESGLESISIAYVFRGWNILHKKSAEDRKYYLEMSQKDFFKEILSDLYEFENFFEKYLFEEAAYGEINTVGDFYFNSANNLLEKIVTSDSEIVNFEIIKKSYNILNFNYTDPYDLNRWKIETFQETERPQKFSNVHGRALMRDDGINRVIFGIDNKNYTPSDLIYPFTKTFRTVVMYSDLSAPTYAVVKNVFDKNIKVIKFYGHSLAEADYSYFQAIFDYYDLYNNNDLQLYFYFSRHGSKTSQEMILEQATELRS